jgi:hypothetical protein
MMVIFEGALMIAAEMVLPVIKVAAFVTAVALAFALVVPAASRESRGGQSNHGSGGSAQKNRRGDGRPILQHFASP